MLFPIAGSDIHNPGSHPEHFWDSLPDPVDFVSKFFKIIFQIFQNTFQIFQNTFQIFQNISKLIKNIPNKSKYFQINQKHCLLI